MSWVGLCHGFAPEDGAGVSVRVPTRGAKGTGLTLEALRAEGLALMDDAAREQRVRPPPDVIALGEVLPEVSAATLFPEEGRAADHERDLGHVAGLEAAPRRGSLGRPARELGEPRDRLFQPRAFAHDADLLPRERADLRGD